MKTTPILFGLLLLAAGLITFTTKAPANNTREPAGAIVFGSRVNYTYVTNEVTGVYRYTETQQVVTWVSRSPNAPQIQRDSDVAENIAYLLDQGYEFMPNLPRSEYLFIKRPR